MKQILLMEKHFRTQLAAHVKRAGKVRLMPKMDVGVLHLMGASGVAPNKTSKTLFPTQTLTEMLAANRHQGRCLDILKCDIEGHEFGLLTRSDWSQICVGILLVEVHDSTRHIPHDSPTDSAGSFTIGYQMSRGYYHVLEQAGFALYSSEAVCPGSSASGNECDGLQEQGWVNTSWLRAKIETLPA